MKNLVILASCLLFFMGCDKNDAIKKPSPANGTYAVNIKYHSSPYRSGPGDTLLKDFDTSYVGSIVISGYEDTIDIASVPQDLYLWPAFTGPLYLLSSSGDTLKYKQPYPAPSGAGYGSIEKTLYYNKSTQKIYYYLNYISGHDGSFHIELSQQ